MNRLMLSLCVALALPTLAQAQAIGSSSAKPAAPAKKAAPAAKKPAAKPYVMSRDELRSCLKTQQENKAENTAIDAEKDAFQKERDEIIASKDALQKRAQALETLAKSIVANTAVLQEAAKEFEKPVEKSELKAAEARRVEFNDKVMAHERRVAEYNAEQKPYNAAKDVLDAQIAANNARGRKLQSRSEDYNLAIDEWKDKCGNKPYDTADEAAVKKELGI